LRGMIEGSGLACDMIRFHRLHALGERRADDLEGAESPACAGNLWSPTYAARSP
jgi:hypothetical protein